MKRETHKLTRSPYDLLVIGGGIYGAWTAYDAALRGLKVALIEKNDWASGTSSASSKLIHGGLRYLEQFKFGLVKTSLLERYRLSKLAPHRVRPLRFLIPIYRKNPVGPFRMKAGLMLYDFLASRDQPVAPHESFNPDEVLTRYPFLKKKGLQMGFSYGDCQMDDARFTLEIIDGAYQAGAVTLNYVEALKILTKEGRAFGAVVQDKETGKTVEIHASMVVNAAGPWASNLNNDTSLKKFYRMVKGIHLVMPPLPNDDAILIMAKQDKRIFFLIPWYGKTLLGTTDSDFQGNPDEVSVEEEDIAYLLHEANLIFREPIWDRASILGSFAGVRALRNETKKHPSLISRKWSIEEPCRGLLISVGGKFTSARHDASKLVDRVMKLLNKPASGATPTENRNFPWSPGEAFEEWKGECIRKGVQLGLDPETAEWSIYRYGVLVNEIHNLIKMDSSLADRIIPDLPFSKAEIVQCATKEMVIHLEDLLRRRIPLLILNRIPRKTLEETASLAAPILNWTSKKCEKEIDIIALKYHIGAH